MTGTSEPSKSSHFPTNPCVVDKTNYDKRKEQMCIDYCVLIIILLCPMLPIVSTL